MTIEDIFIISFTNTSEKCMTVLMARKHLIIPFISHSNVKNKQPFGAALGDYRCSKLTFMLKLQAVMDKVCSINIKRIVLDFFSLRK